MGKLMQTQSACFALVEMPSGDLLEFEGKGLSMVQILENGTGRTICKAQGVYDLVKNSVDKFQEKGSNRRAG